jgi:hypothetical protein
MKYSLRSLMTFSIRDLFWLTVVVALAVGWAVDRRSAASDRRRFEAEAAEISVKVRLADAERQKLEFALERAREAK